MIDHPRTWRKWAAAAVALGVLAVGVALLDDGNVSWSLPARLVAAFAIGVVAAAVWWALSWLDTYDLPPRHRDDPTQ